MLIGTLTGGGDCPGLNAALRAVVKRADKNGWSVVGIRNGWEGVIKGVTEPLPSQRVSGIIHLGGTILGSSRTNPFKTEERGRQCLEAVKRLGIDALIAIGGEDTLGAAAKLHAHGFPVVGVPKTIDNDLNGTDYTFGFDTAVTIATEAIDRLHTTAEAHQRCMVVEVMGRHAGWIAVISGIAGGADVILIPEKPFHIDEVCGLLNQRRGRGKSFSIVVVAEGAKPKEGTLATLAGHKDEFGHVRLGGIGQLVCEEIEKRTKIESRVTVLGHIQRGGTPTAFDRVLATRYGVGAVELVEKKKFGRMVSIRGTEVTDVALAEATGKLKTVDAETYRTAEIFFG